jgi:WD40 repeat protein
VTTGTVGHSECGASKACHWSVAPRLLAPAAARRHHRQGHLLPIANLALHPTKPILATASDDKTWKLWHLPARDLIMCGEGHRCDEVPTTVWVAWLSCRTTRGGVC